MDGYPDIRDVMVGVFRNHRISFPGVPGYVLARASRRHISDQGCDPDDKNCFPTRKFTIVVRAENNDDHGLS